MMSGLGKSRMSEPAHYRGQGGYKSALNGDKALKKRNQNEKKRRRKGPLPKSHSPEKVKSKAPFFKLEEKGGMAQTRTTQDGDLCCVTWCWGRRERTTTPRLREGGGSSVGMSKEFQDWSM